MGLPAPVRTGPPAARIPVANGSNRINAFLDKTVTPGTETVLTVTETHELLGIIVPAGGTRMVELAGISFYFPFLSSVLGIDARAINGGASRSFVHFQRGTGLRFGTTGFQRIELRNPDPANALTVNIVVGGGIPNQSYDEYIDNRAVIQNVTGVNITVQNGATTVVGYKTRDNAWADTLAAGASQVVTDGYNGLARKAIIFANDDVAAVLTVLDAAGNILGSVQPSTSWTTDVGGTITLKNPTANAVTCHIGEVYYS